MRGAVIPTSIVALLLLSVGASAVTLDAQRVASPMYVEPGTTSFALVSDISASQDAAAYVKVLPNPSNPLYRNGTVDQEGWWMTAILDGTTMGHSNGWNEIELGQLKANVTSTLRLEITAPANASDASTRYQPAAILALRSDPGDANGAVRNPSRALSTLLIFGSPPVETTQPAPGASVDVGAAQSTNQPEATSAPWTTVLIVGAIIILAFAGWRFSMERAQQKVHDEYKSIFLGIDDALAHINEEDLMGFLQSPAGKRYMQIVTEHGAGKEAPTAQSNDAPSLAEN